jgi:hypothetical protein
MVLDKDLSFDPASYRFKRNHARELHRLQSRSIAGSPGPELRCMPFRPVFEGLSEERLDKAA